MKRLILLSCVLAFVGCTNSPTERGNSNGTVYVNPPQNTNVVVTPAASNIGDNLDLQALGELVKNSKDATDIETKLNTPGSINNLDLDGDGQVDYIKVTEYGSGNSRGLSFSIDLANNEKQEVATIEIQQLPNQQQAAMNIAGNNQIYGDNTSYSSNFTVSDFILLHYLFTPHSYYYSPYRYGYYPSYYHSYRPIVYSSYRSNIGTRTKSTTIKRTTTTTTTTLKSPNSTATSSYVKKTDRSLSNPTKSQKSFEARTTTTTPNTSGFSNSNKSRIATPPPTSSSSTRSYGNSSSSFGSNKSSGSSSFGSGKSSGSSSSSRSSSSGSSKSFGSSKSSFGSSRSSSSRSSSSSSRSSSSSSRSKK